jgi:hypothetical protein
LNGAQLPNIDFSQAHADTNDLSELRSGTSTIASFRAAPHGRADLPSVDPNQLDREAKLQSCAGKEITAMPIETALVLLAIVVPFAVFAGVLAWAQSRTN